MGSLQPWHWFMIALVLIVLLGSKKLPDAARSLGKSLRIFKSEVRELQNDDKSQTPSPAQAVQSERVDTEREETGAREQPHTDARPA